MKTIPNPTLADFEREVEVADQAFFDAAREVELRHAHGGSRHNNHHTLLRRRSVSRSRRHSARRQRMRVVASTLRRWRSCARWSPQAWHWSPSSTLR